MQYDITISESAYGYISKMIAKENGIAFKLTVKKTGCSGFSYVPKIITEINAKDLEITERDSPVRVFVDSQWLELLSGIKIDYLEEDKFGLKQKRLVFINPQETSRCGCGESFHVS